MSKPKACCQGASQSADAMATDPVCGMQVNPATAKHVSTHDGRTFHFCSAGCKTKFEAAPASYLAAAGKRAAAGSCCAGKTAATPDHTIAGHTHAEKDPVCGMTVDPHTAKLHVEHAGHTYYFCGQRCSDKFMAEPLAWLEGRAAPPVAAPGAIYTCPMHPEVQQVGPGECPKCGMALEPMLPSEDENDGGEVRAMTRRFWLLVAITLPVFALAMAYRFNSIGGASSGARSARPSVSPSHNEGPPRPRRWRAASPQSRGLRAPRTVPATGGGHRSRERPIPANGSSGPPNRPPFPRAPRPHGPRAGFPGHSRGPRQPP